MKCQYCKKIHENNNTGCSNSGDWNSGDRNSGYRNSGHRNSGNLNSGDWNSGYRNSGNLNSGDWNSGDWNSGNRNSGDWNSGDRNSGYRNSGNLNSGNLNSGYRNSGNLNSGDWNSGAFNTDCPKMRLFNKELDITVEEFYDEYDISADIPLNRWIDSEDMTEAEKKEVKGWETMGGYLKTLEYKEACKIWWKENPSEHERFTSLPEFNAAIFEEITGIKVGEKETIKIGEHEYDKAEVEKL
jgi:hypothetical protein